jgi:hypothetical protein
MSFRVNMVRSAEFATLGDLRATLYLENPGEQLVAVQRDDFCSQVLGVYKNPSFDMLKQPMVVFIGEAGKATSYCQAPDTTIFFAYFWSIGRDVGALTKEYFWRGMTELDTGKICNLPLFEGEMDHRVPTCDGALLRSGKFKELGRFICHSALHSGIGFIGLSAAVVEYICAKEICSDTILPITVLDVPDFEKRWIIEKVREHDLW